MIALPHAKGKTYGVFGLGRSGNAAAAALAASGARVLAWDDRIEAVPDGCERFDFLNEDWPLLDGIVWSPGIPFLHPTPHPVAVHARRVGCPLVADIDLLVAARPDAVFVGVTGTNGKSTTTALLAHLLDTAGREAVAGGNIGAAALELPELGEGGTYVIELSSYQLELCQTAAFSVGIWLNLTADHLDRHGGLHGYAAAKSRLWSHAKPGDIAIVGMSGSSGRNEADRARAAGRTVLPIAGSAYPGAALATEDGLLLDSRNGRPTVIVDLGSCRSLPGEHNAENAAAATAAALSLGLTADEIAEGLKSFPGLAHRQERVRQIGKATYVNDSKATNAESTAKALVCYDNIYWIAGGLAKAGGIGPLAPYFSRIRHAFLVGDAAAGFGETLTESGIPASNDGDVLTALTQAHAAAQRDPQDSVVLLSPACASFDQWPSFEARGDAFRDAVLSLEIPDPQSGRR